MVFSINIGIKAPKKRRMALDYLHPPHLSRIARTSEVGQYAQLLTIGKPDYTTFSVIMLEYDQTYKD